MCIALKFKVHPFNFHPTNYVEVLSELPMAVRMILISDDVIVESFVQETASVKWMIRYIFGVLVQICEL